MCYRKDSKLLGGNLIDDAVWESTQDISPTGATKHSADLRVVQNEIGRSLEFGHKREAKPDIRL